MSKKADLESVRDNLRWFRDARDNHDPSSERAYLAQALTRLVDALEDDESVSATPTGGHILLGWCQRDLLPPGAIDRFYEKTSKALRLDKSHVAVDAAAFYRLLCCHEELRRRVGP